MKDIIKINVIGKTGTGKTQVMAVIEKALIDFYGPHTQVVSYDLSVEKSGAPDCDVFKLSKNTGQVARQEKTIFVISEINAK